MPPIDDQMMLALREDLALAYDAKGFLGSHVLKDAITGMLIESYKDLRRAQNREEAWNAALKARAVDALYQRILRAANAGETALDTLAQYGGAS